MIINVRIFFWKKKKKKKKNTSSIYGTLVHEVSSTTQTEKETSWTDKDSNHPLSSPSYSLEKKIIIWHYLKIPYIVNILSHAVWSALKSPERKNIANQNTILFFWVNPVCGMDGKSF